MGASASVMGGGLEGEGPSPPANVGERDNAITSAAKVAEVDVAEIVGERDNAITSAAKVAEAKVAEVDVAEIALLRSGAAAAAPGLPE